MRKARRFSPLVLLLELALLLLVLYGGWKLVKLGMDRYYRMSYPLKYQTLVEENCRELDLDPALVYAVIRTESGFDPAAESHLGAKGLMQLMPDAYDWVRMRWGEPQDSDYEALYDPEVGALYGCRMLRLLLDEFETETNALAAYHGGWGSVKQWLENPDYSQDGENLAYIPFDDTRAYVEKVLKTMEIYRRLYGL